jgi:hypothetical protein
VLDMSISSDNGTNCDFQRQDQRPVARLCAYVAYRTELAGITGNNASLLVNVLIQRESLVKAKGSIGKGGE